MVARPRKEGMDYYPHDTDAVDDEKIDAMRSMFGNDGYAFYFILCERIYRTENSELDVSKPILKAAAASKVRVSMDTFDDMMQAALDIGLFNREAYEFGIITSNGIKKRAETVKAMRKRWRNGKENTPKEELANEFSAEKTTEETPESKAKQSKVNNKVNNKLNNSTTTPNAFAVFEQEGFGTLSSTLADKIGDFIDDFGERWVIEAMKEAAYHGKRSLPYVKSILEDYRKRGVDEPWTVERKKLQPDKTQPGYTKTGKPDMKVVSNGTSQLVSQEERERMRELARKLDAG